MPLTSSLKRTEQEPCPTDTGQTKERLWNTRECSRFRVALNKYQSPRHHYQYFSSTISVSYPYSVTSSLAKHPPCAALQRSHPGVYTPQKLDLSESDCLLFQKTQSNFRKFKLITYETQDISFLTQVSGINVYSSGSLRSSKAIRLWFSGCGSISSIPVNTGAHVSLTCCALDTRVRLTDADFADSYDIPEDLRTSALKH